LDKGPVETVVGVQHHSTSTRGWKGLT
jgi:hypothetical protein